MNDKLKKTLAAYYAKFGEPFPIDISDERGPDEITAEVRRFIRLGVKKLITDNYKDEYSVY
ncbi:MAG: hypothetical protein PHU51_06250 [Candidatus Nanoarchaeia archaeon]|nr:hypothetical protein [Candidatus Nanoarchaeia archaeon]